MAHDELHALAREVAETLAQPDKKQLRFNEIVLAAVLFYPGRERGGVIELVQACDKASGSLYDKAAPMWASLQSSYAWMVAK